VPSNYIQTNRQHTRVSDVKKMKVVLALADPTVTQCLQIVFNLDALI